MAFWRHPLSGSLLLFLACWLFFGALINARDMQDFNLQHIGIEAIVERHHLWLEGSPTPQLQTRGDVFQYNDHTYAAKQPGQFLFGAAAYRVASAFGLSYRADYVRTAAWVTFGSASLLLALGITAIQRTSQRWLGDYGLQPLSYLTALAAAGGTTLLAYSGLPHHDLIAAALLVCAASGAYAASQERQRGWAQVRALLAGLCLGLTLTTSMLPLFSAVVVAVYAVAILTWSERAALLTGGIAGLLPLLLYNYASFGNPLLMANVAGNFNDTFWHFDLQNVQEKAGFYLRMTLQHAPLVMLGFIGLVLLPRHLSREKLMLGGASVALVAYLLGIETVGHCQFGPRYLLPVIPLLLLGLNGLWLSRLRGLGYALTLMLGSYGLLINLGGTLGGSMYCTWWEFGGARRWESLIHGSVPELPLQFLLWPAAGTGLLLAAWVWRYSRTAQS